MKLDQLRMVIGFSVIASHFLCLFLIATTDTLTFAERIGLSVMVGPIFALFAAVIVRGMAAGMLDKWDDTPVHPTFAIAATSLALIFSAAAPIAILLFINGTISTVSDLRTSLGAVETCLGGYTGLLVDALFGRGEKVKVTKRSTPRRRSAAVATKSEE